MEKGEGRVMYRCSTKVMRDDTETLAVHCSDHRIRAGLREFLDDELGLQENYDSIVVPGGPQCLVELNSLPKFSWVARKWLRALIRLHSLKRLVLVAHMDCGWYCWLEEFAPSQGPVRRQQEEDLRAAKRAVSQLCPGVAVDLFFAAWNEVGDLSVEEVGD
jgi:hypothetical protein